MATWTKSELSANVLSALGVKPAGQAAAAEDDILVQGIIDSQHEELKVEGLVPFETSAVPEWAQQGMTFIIMAHAGMHFGLGYNEALEKKGKAKLKTQIMGQPLYTPLKVVDY